MRDIGRGFVAYLGRRQIAVSRDMRLSSPSLADAFIEGARAQGADVIDYGMMATDMMYFAVASDGARRRRADHRVAQPVAVQRHQDGARRGAAAQRRRRPGRDPRHDPERHAAGAGGDAGTPDEPRRDGRLRRARLLVHRRGRDQAVQVRARRRQRHGRPGGAEAVRAAALPGRSRCAWRWTGRFPNHESNPLIEENRAHIVERVVAEKADIGIAWDGDADRCFFIDGTGDFISGDFITALLAEAILRKRPGATIVYDLRASHAVKDIVTAMGGTAIMNRVGHSFIKKTMRDKDGVFGGEVTGHYYFRENFYADNGFIPALMLLELMSVKGQSLAELLAPLKAKYFISGEINTKVASMDVVQAKLDGLSKRYADGTVTHLDGVSVEYPGWHFNVRPSNTEPLLRLNLEATTPEQMAEKRDEVLAFIR